MESNILTSQDTFSIVSGSIGILGVILSAYFYHRQSLLQQRLASRDQSDGEKMTMVHWQLQAMHHSANRIENILLDPERPDRGAIEVARGIRDSADALMGQAVDDVYIFPWACVSIRDPATGEEVGRSIGGEHHYKKDFPVNFPTTIDGSYKVGTPNTRDEAEPDD